MTTTPGRFSGEYLRETARIIEKLDVTAIDRAVQLLSGLRSGDGRLFIVGTGGGAGHASHAVNDFRKIAGIEAYTPTDNVSELTARINDDGWETSYVNWLRTSRIGSRDMLLVLSVGGGDLERGVSVNLVRCIEYARQVGARICGIVGRDGGYTARVADVAIVIPPINPETITAQTEGLQSVIWHLLVAHPTLRLNEMRWESLR
jgi:D-sedoheptulose 7-phosphate isomerase